MTDGGQPPFPLAGGRAGDGGGTLSAPRARPRPVPGSVPRARRLRQEQTFAERLLREALRKRRMNFRRRAPVGRFVVDFAHFGSSLIIEVDGYHHTLPERQARDAERDAWFSANGFRVLRVAAKQVQDDLTAVVDRIVAEAAPTPSPTLPPSRGKGEKRCDVR